MSYLQLGDWGLFNSGNYLAIIACLILLMLAIWSSLDLRHVGITLVPSSPGAYFYTLRLSVLILDDFLTLIFQSMNSLFSCFDLPFEGFIDFSL